MKCLTSAEKIQGVLYIFYFIFISEFNKVFK